MIYYKPQSLNPDKHPLMPGEYPWVINKIRMSPEDIAISEEDLNALFSSISIAAWEAEIRRQENLELVFQGLGELPVEVKSTITTSPFASKKWLFNGVEYSLFKRVVGIQQDVVEGENIILFTVPYPWAKIRSVDMVNCLVLETGDFYVLDSATGTYSGVPNYVLNQFAFDVNMSKDFFKCDSEYDADVYQGMQFKIVYNSKSAKTVGINFKFDEVK